MENVLETYSLCKSYGKFKALDEVNMRIPKGSIYGFIGRNGAGKTTLIRVVCGLQDPDSGAYYIYGAVHKGKEIAKARRRMGAVVETPAIYLDLTAEENLRQQYRILGLPSFEGVSDLLKLVRLENTGKKHVRNFSLGMKQRLGIAMALAGDPDFLVLDEPVNGLDPQGIVEIRELILRLNQANGITVLISSHILDELSKLATHYGFIDKGRIVKEISAEELHANCRKCVRVEVSNINALSRILDQNKIEYKVISDNQANIYGEISISKLAAMVSAADCELISASDHNESLESYYIRLVGGDSNG